MFWNDLKTEIEICNRCSLGNIRRQPVLGKGKESSDIMVILEDISEEEEKNKELLSDKKGLYFKKFLNFSELDINDIYFTTLVKCSSHGEIASNKSIQSCDHYLYTQIALINPKVIITMGEIPSKLFLDNSFKDIRSVVGEIFIYNEHASIVPLYDLNYLFKASDKEKWILVETLKKIKKEVI